MGEHAKNMRESLETSPDFKRFIGALSPEQMSYHAKTIGLIAGECEKNTQIVMQHIDEKCLTAEDLEAREDHYMDVLRRSHEKQGKEFREIMVDVISRHDEEQQKKFQEVKLNQDKHEHEIALLRQSNASQAIQSDQQMTMMKMIHASQESLSELIEAKFKASTSSTAPKPKQSALSKLPAPVWLAIIGAFTALAAGTATAWVYIKTGQIVLFGG